MGVMQSSNPMTEAANPWVGRVCSDLGHFFGRWLTFLPNTTDGLGYIQELNYLVRNNPAGIFFLNRLESRTGGRDRFCPEVLDWTTRWLAARMDYMDSEESTKLIPGWVQYVNYNTTSPLSDYDVPDPDMRVHKLQCVVQPGAEEQQHGPESAAAHQ